LLTIPITILTLGFFLLVINAVIIIFAEKLVPGFHVDGFVWALFFSLILSLFTSVLNLLLGVGKESD
jgi:putative membrane protein